MTDAINWHPNGFRGPWEVANWGIQYYSPSGDGDVEPITIVSDKWVVAIVVPDLMPEVETNARAIAEVPAMVMALRELDSIWREFFPDGPDGKYGLVSIGGEQAATWRNICAILARIDGSAA